MGYIVWMILLGCAFISLFFVHRHMNVWFLEEKEKNAQSQRSDVSEAYVWELGSRIGKYVIAGCIALFTIIATIYTVDSGEAVIFLQFGRVYDSDSTAGIGFKRPWAKTIAWRTRLEPINERIEARDSKEMIITLDVTIWWAVHSDKLEELYSKIAKNYEDLEKGFVMPGIRAAVRDEIGKTTFNDILVDREKYAISITEYVARQLASKHVRIDKVNIRNVSPPTVVNEAIESRLQAKQKQDEMELQLEIAKKQADIRREEAKGIADAQLIIQRKLSPLYVQYEGIQMMKSLAGSTNSTFVFIPTSSTAAGVPMVWQAPIK